MTSVKQLDTQGLCMCCTMDYGFALFSFANEESSTNRLLLCMACAMTGEAVRIQACGTCRAFFRPGESAVMKEQVVGDIMAQTFHHGKCVPRCADCQCTVSQPTYATAGGPQVARIVPNLRCSACVTKCMWCQTNMPRHNHNLNVRVHEACYEPYAAHKLTWMER